jgi:hypothetical protein
MKKNIILITALLTALLSSCEKDFLERKSLDRISSEQVFSDKKFLEAYLYQCYNYMPVGYGMRNLADPSKEKTPGVITVGYGNAYILDCVTDIMTNKSGWPMSNAQLVRGLIDPANNDLDNWAQKYEGIRFCNDLIKGLDGSSLDSVFVARIISEARFIRAYHYIDLARRYGGVPIITKLQSLDNLDSLFVSRNTLDEVYDFIDNEFTEIAEYLPSAATLPEAELGRATKEACWAFDSKAMLFAERWAHSAELAKKVIDAGVYTLSSDYNALFQSYGGDKEVIFEVLFNGAEKGHSFDILAYPFSFRADWGSQILPTQELVDSYEMTNGLPISDPASGYDSLNPFLNRDSRLAATVLYNGNIFKGKSMDYTISSNPAIVPNGPDAPLGDVNNTTTGYNLKKFMDESLPDGPGWGVSKTSWKELRYAEVLLIYAEAQNNAVGPDASVYEAINQVRERAGLPNLPSGLTKEEMFQRIVQERKVEFAGEGQRYWDIRRWHIGPQVLDGTVAHGTFITRIAENPDSLVYKKIVVDKSKRPTFVYLPRFDLMPIPQSEMDKNPNLEQNPDY